jgi:hypothetical protein
MATDYKDPMIAKIDSMGFIGICNAKIQLENELKNLDDSDPEYKQRVINAIKFCDLKKSREIYEGSY